MTTEREIQPVILRDQGLYTIDDLAAVVLNDARDLVRQKEGAEHPDVKKLWAAIEELAADGLSDDHSEFMLAAEVLADHGYVAFSDGDHGTWVVYEKPEQTVLRPDWHDLERAVFDEYAVAAGY